jgi:FixJ family two-component response regulator
MSLVSAVLLLCAQQLINSVNLDEILNRLKTSTPREHEVLNQVVSGRLNKEIA